MTVGPRRRRRRVAAIAASCLAGWLANAPDAPLQALDPAKAVTQYLLDVWQAEQGLPQNSVSAVLRTRDGYLWAGTEQGLVRFDGIRFTVFDRRNTEAMPSNGISALLEDRAGQLWVGTARGLVKRASAGGGFERVDAAAGDLRISTLLEDRHGRLWVGTRGAGLLRLEAGKLIAPASEPDPSPSVTALPPGRRIRALREAADGALWLATEAGVSRFIGRELTTLTQRDGLLDNSTFDLWFDPDGTLWIATDGGLQRLRDGHLRGFTTRDGLSSNQIRALYRDRAGSFWVGTQGGGLNRLRAEAGPSRDAAESTAPPQPVGTLETSETFVIGVLDAARGLSSNIVNAILEDSEGSLWLGTSTGGLARLRDGRVTTFGRAEGLPADVVYATLEDRQGAVWLGMSSGGVARIRAGGNGGDGAVRIFGIADGLPSATVTALAEDEGGTVWAGTYGGGLARFEGGRFRVPFDRRRLADPSVYALLAARGGGLWIGTGGGGLHRLTADPGGHREHLETWTVADGLPGGFVQALLEEPRGALWIGTNEGLARLEGGRLAAWTTADGLPDRSVLALHQEPAGALWIGTAGGGLSQFADGRFATVQVGEGLAEDMVGRLLPDRSGRLWMCGNRGLSAVVVSEVEELFAGRRERIVPLTLGAGDGMRSAECYGGTQPAGMVTRDGHLWFPTIRGAVVFDPDHLPTNPHPPPVVIESLEVDGNGLAPRDGMRLAAGSHALEIDYTALALREPGKVRFRYRLEGFDPGWTEAGARRVAYYTELPHGDYRLEVRAANEDGVWNDTGASLAFSVAPRLVETGWFRLLAAATGLALLYATYRLRVWRLEARQRELESVVAARTGELSVANRELERLASLDGLTQIPNRRSFDEALRAAWADHRRRGAALAVALADVDFFKLYNDSRGHPEGDRALIAIAQALHGCLRRETDLAARYGGEEMVLLLRDSDAAGAARVAGEALDRVRALKLPHPSSAAAPFVTLSIGIAAMIPGEGSDAADLLARADQALYRAKAAGRNRVVLDEGGPA